MRFNSLRFSTVRSSEMRTVCCYRSGPEIEQKTNDETICAFMRPTLSYRRAQSSSTFKKKNLRNSEWSNVSPSIINSETDHR